MLRQSVSLAHPFSCVPQNSACTRLEFNIKETMFAPRPSQKKKRATKKRAGRFLCVNKNGIFDCCWHATHDTQSESTNYRPVWEIHSNKVITTRWSSSLSALVLALQDLLQHDFACILIPLFLFLVFLFLLLLLHLRLDCAVLY